MGMSVISACIYVLYMCVILKAAMGPDRMKNLQLQWTKVTPSLSK